jgi:site-specific DNA-methyltransferase (adenine-specific)
MLTITNEDNMLLMARYPDNYFDLAIVDPPYGIGVNMQMGKKKGEKGRYEKKKWDDSIPDKIYFDELKRVSKSQIIWGGNYFTENLKPSMGWIIWNKLVPEGVSFSDF